MIKQTQNTLPDPLITILTPVYNEEKNLVPYYNRVQSTLINQSQFKVKILFIDDGSSDGSWKIIENICSKNNYFNAIRLSRNFGSHIALTAGFSTITKGAVATLACDLQDPPETILHFFDKWKNGAKIVWGKRRSREDTTWKVVTSSFFHALLKKFAMPAGSSFSTGSFFLADPIVVQCYKEFGEHNRITFALIAWTGFDQDVVEYDRVRRVAGSSNWNFKKMIKAMYDAFIGFSMLPIKIMSYTSILVSFLALLIGTYICTLWVIGNPIPGWSSTMFAMSVFFGIQFFLFSIMGEYLYRIYTEVVRRPLFFISDRITDIEEADQDSKSAEI